MRGRRGIRLAATLVLVSLLAAASLVGAADPPDEQTVKAAILFNVARFTEWPPTAFGTETAPVVLCVLGGESVGALERLDGKTLKGRAFAVRHADDTRLRQCHIVYISPEHGDLAPVLKAAERFTILTVSDIDRFARKGGMIGLVNEGGKVRFEINLRAAEQAGLKLSSQLLKLASIVRN